MKIEEVREIDHLDNPEGNNDLGSTGLYYWRDLYKSFSYPEGTSARSKPIDFWYEDMFYGRVDSNNYPIYPLEASLKQLTGQSTVLSLSFVAEAWEDLRVFMSESVKMGSAIRSSVYSALEPVAGWKSIHNLYHDWNSMMYESFSGPFMNPERDQKIKDFSGFLKVYTEFIQHTAVLFPTTREAYTLSRRCSTLISGLIIEIAALDPSDDSAKTAFFEDENFDYISIAAKKHGFKIDKNAPWRFIADLDSPAMKKYMIESFGDKKRIHDLLYLRTYEYDIDVFKHYAWGWYNQYIVAKPMLQIVKEGRCKKTTSILVQREVLTEEQAIAKIPDSKWLRLYAFTRAIEARKDWNQVKFDSVVRESLEYSKYRGRNTGMKYLYSKIKDYPKKQYSVGKRLTDKEIDAIIRSNINKGVKGTFNF